LVAGSNPAEPTIEAKYSQKLLKFYENAQVQPQASELLQLRELLFILLGNKGRRQLELRQKTNDELFTLYEGELAFHHRSARGLHEAKRVLNHFHNYLGEFPPTPELAKSFLSQFKDRKSTTIARYVAILKVFFKWYGEELDIKIRIPKILPSYVDKSKIDKLLEALKSKRSHKETIYRDILLVDHAIQTGLRHSELASLRVGDIDGKTGDFIPRGNVLMEIGILQEILKGKIIYLLQKGTKFPTNINEKVWERFSPQSMDKAFIKVARELIAFGILKAVKP